MDSQVVPQGGQQEAEASAERHREVRSRVQVGGRAPDFTLPDQTGKPVRLTDLLAMSAVVLYFYPKDETRGCTAEACAFRDDYEVFREAGAQVVGVSSDSVASHQRFAAHHRLPFTLLSDRGGKVRRQYGAPRALFGLAPGRVTYIIDRQGIVRYVFNSLILATQHVSEALRVLRELPAE